MASVTLLTLWRNQKGQCRYCKCFTALADATIDHVIPRSKGGKHKGNTVMACWTCNNLKADMSVAEFTAMREQPILDRRPRLAEARLMMWQVADQRRCTDSRE